MSEPRRHALSFDVEEYFQVANLAGVFPRSGWEQVPSRLDVGMHRILDVLDRSGARATFFFLGWVAERRPDLVLRCHAAGHEIASHGYSHRFLGELGPEGLDEELERTERALEAAGVPRPVGFRASTFTLTRSTWWALDVLAKRGYRYDSSIHPVRHPTYGIPGFEPGISVVRGTEGGELLEFPVSTFPFLGRNWPVGGGGWFRLLPGVLHRAALSHLEALGRATAIYLHPWEFDPEQPRMPVPALARFRHYLNLGRSLPRLEQLTQRFQFGTLREVLEGQGYADHFEDSTPVPAVDT